MYWCLIFFLVQHKEVKSPLHVENTDRLKHLLGRQDQNNMSKGISYKPKDPRAILGPGKRKDQREIVEEQEETEGSQSCERKRLAEVLKVPKPSQAKIDSCFLLFFQKKQKT